jgi:hypothetical protein
VNQANRRPPARTGGVSPVVQVGLVVVALILGFIILRSAFDDDDGSAADTPDVTEPETGTTDVVPTTTAAATDLTTAQVLVVNGAGVQGLAGRVTEALQGAGVPTLEPTTANSKFQGSGVYGSTGFEQQARAVGNMLGIDSVQSFPAQFPLEDPNALGNANVVVIIGTDLAEFAGVTATTTAGAAGTTTTAAGAATTSTG